MDGKIIFKVYQIAACICLSANKYDYERHKEKNTKPSSQSWLLGSAWISSHSVISLGTPVIAAPSPGNENFGKATVFPSPYLTAFHSSPLGHKPHSCCVIIISSSFIISFIITNIIINNIVLLISVKTLSLTKWVPLWPLG